MTIRYIVSDGYSFTHAGKTYSVGDSIPSDIFSCDDLNAQITKGAIVVEQQADVVTETPVVKKSRSKRAKSQNSDENVELSKDVDVEEDKE